jgi:riboflavin biosynthesis pyrimidine reductase
MEPIHTLLATQPIAPSEGVLPEDLRARYGGDLSFPPAPEGRPYCIANRFTMGLLRASVDAILVGPGTLLATGPEGAWLPESVYPAAKETYKKYRTEVLQKPEYPLVVIVTGSGELDLASAVFHTPQTRVLILTTEQGKRTLAHSGSEALASVEVKALPATGKSIDPSAIFTWLRQQAGVELLLHEAGPTLFGQFLAAEFPAAEFPAAGYIDELFLTVAPQIAGRSPEHPRPGLVEKTQFSPATAPWWKLVSVRNAADYLFLRYRRSLP